MNFVVRHAIQQGVRPITAFQMATLNPAERFGVARDVGSVTPGSYADIILLDGNLADVNVVMTIAAGQLVAENGQFVAELPPFTYPPEAMDTVRLHRQLAADDFAITAPAESGTAQVRSIRVIENSVETREEIITLPVRTGKLQIDPPGQPDVCKLVIIERHRATGELAHGLVSGVGFNIPAAMATTVAHDSHNLMILGNSDELMARAGNELANVGGGICVVTEGPDGPKSITLPLPIDRKSVV